MKKQFKNYSVIWAIALVLFNVIVFAVPNESEHYSKFGGAFWASYIFIMLAFIGQFAVSYFFFKEENKDKVFLNMPIFTLGRTCLILALIFGTALMIIPDCPQWLGAIIAAVVLAFYAISVIKAKAAGEAVEEIGEKVKAKTLFIKSLTVDAESLLARATTPEAKEACKKVLEAVRYSDPMSNDALAGVESQIMLKFNEFSSAVTSSAENVRTLADELVILVGDRNKKCKLLK